MNPAMTLPHSDRINWSKIGEKNIMMFYWDNKVTQYDLCTLFLRRLPLSVYRVCYSDGLLKNGFLAKCHFINYDICTKSITFFKKWLIKFANAGSFDSPTQVTAFLTSLHTLHPFQSEEQASCGWERKECLTLQRQSFWNSVQIAAAFQITFSLNTVFFSEKNPIRADQYFY